MGLISILESIGLHRPRGDLEAAKRQQAEASSLHQSNTREARDRTADAIAQFIHDIQHQKMRAMIRRGE